MKIMQKFPETDFMLQKLPHGSKGFIFSLFEKPIKLLLEVQVQSNSLKNIVNRLSVD
jgi:hypothetical protein